MIELKPFTTDDFQQLISWIHNRELLVTIAGNYFSYPLTVEQLNAYLKDVNSHSFNIVDTATNRIIGHAEIYKTGNGIYKIDKLIIGDTASRGKGLCQPVIKALADYAFTELQATTMELNVFDWNTAAIRCYQKSGFVINADNTALFTIGDEQWTALNMVAQIKQD
jgi:RimJ/RimL family protein N-acetyltransferase